MTPGWAAALVAAGGLAAVLLWPGAVAPAVRGPAPHGGRVHPAAAATGRRWGAVRALRRRRSPHGPGPSPDELGDALVLLALALRAGLPLTGALHHVRAGATGTVRRDLAAVLAAVGWGHGVQEAWAFAGPAWRPAALATQLAEQTGAAPALFMQRAAVRLREQQERERERRAARAGVLLVLPLGFGFLPAFACTAVIPVVLALADGVLGAPP